MAVEVTTTTNFPKSSRKLEHGTVCWCGSCGSHGHWDKMNSGTSQREAEFEDAIWFNPYEGQIECYECWLK